MDLCTHLNVLSFVGVVLLNCCIEEVPHAFNFRVLNNHINSSKLRAAYVGVEPGLGLIWFANVLYHFWKKEVKSGITTLIRTTLCDKSWPGINRNVGRLLQTLRASIKLPLSHHILLQQWLTLVVLIGLLWGFPFLAKVARIVKDHQLNITIYIQTLVDPEFISNIDWASHEWGAPHKYQRIYLHILQ